MLLVAKSETLKSLFMHDRTEKEKFYGELQAVHIVASWPEEMT